jgi:hypothetical protein
MTYAQVVMTYQVNILCTEHWSDLTTNMLSFVHANNTLTHNSATFIMGTTRTSSQKSFTSSFTGLHF